MRRRARLVPICPLDPVISTRMMLYAPDVVLCYLSAEPRLESTALALRADIPVHTIPPYNVLCVLFRRQVRLVSGVRGASTEDDGRNFVNFLAKGVRVDVCG